MIKVVTEEQTDQMHESSNPHERNADELKKAEDYSYIREFYSLPK
ncbi:hypothetical protein [Halobacillus sp. Marseille-Q1614]|nr:hypothetical protein [Halobacillus sp. Marseille-Q1614]